MSRLSTAKIVDLKDSFKFNISIPKEGKLIIKEIEEGIKKTKANYKVIEDRKEAIKAAIEMANKLDIVVIAGKGHEMYQEVKGKKNEFNEKKIVIEITDELKKKQEEKSTKKKK